MVAGCILCEYGIDVLGTGCIFLCEFVIEVLCTGDMFITFLSMADNTEALLHRKPASARNSDSIFPSSSAYLSS
jgi:hypothetical protein